MLQCTQILYSDIPLKKLRPAVHRASRATLVSFAEYSGADHGHDLCVRQVARFADRKEVVEDVGVRSVRADLQNKY